MSISCIFKAKLIITYIVALLRRRRAVGLGWLGRMAVTIRVGLLLRRRLMLLVVGLAGIAAIRGLLLIHLSAIKSLSDG